MMEAMFRKILFILFLLFGFCLFLSQQVLAVTQPFIAAKQDYEKAIVIGISQEGKIIADGQTNLFQKLVLQVTDGIDTGKIIHIRYGDQQSLTKNQELTKGEVVILLKTTDQTSKISYAIYDKYRLPQVVIVVVFFILIIFAIAQLKGIGSLFGLVISLGVILLFVVPQLLQGNNPLGVSIIGALIILLVTTYIAHGISRQTTVALLATFLSLMATALISIGFVTLSKLSGLGSEDIASLQIGATSVINLQGLLLGGIIIGTLGALNDVTITQSAAIFEIVQTDSSLQFSALVKKGFRIGREHILSLVNTLVLAYAGSSFFIFIYLVLNPQHVPYWVILNSETLTDEIVGTISGSIGLIMAVPIVTLLASWIALLAANATKKGKA
jgi:uncharacterized membrane protein